jgi:error-prone DNA polymerase
MTDTGREFTELHARSSFSFLEASSSPERLAEEAARLGYHSMALVDRDGVYGAPRFFKACRKIGIKPLVGAEITTPEGPVPLLVRNRSGYKNLCRLLTRIHMRAEKGKAEAKLEDLEDFSGGLVCLTGGSGGPLFRRSLESPAAAAFYLRRLKGIFGNNNVYVELQRHFSREQEKVTQAMVQAASRCGLPLLACNGPGYAGMEGRDLYDVLACIKHGTSLDKAGRLLSRNSERYLKDSGEMARLFSDLPEAVRNSRELTESLEFTLQNLGYRFPDYPVPEGENMNSYLRKLTFQGAAGRYRPLHERARAQLEHELKIIEKLELPGYFLIVWDIVQYCRRNKILVQGRGSAANSAVCYSLGITAVDPVGMDLLFERFLSEERGEWPDIDLDLPSGERREQVIQYVYRKYGRRGAAMTATVISCRGKSAAREVGKALGFSPELQGRLSKMLGSWSSDPPLEDEAITEQVRSCSSEAEIGRMKTFLRLWQEIQDLPRHLGQHTGGMIICSGQLDEIVPLENARMPNRSVVQWDKDDCEDLGFIKVDLLGLGMMSAIHDTQELIRASGGDMDLAHIPPDDPKTYKMLQTADTVGVFQVESRAQMATLPRLKPQRFYDLVVEVGIIRPGPISGDMLHPYLQRRAGLEPVTYPHPSLEPILKRTLGVPIFQEQLLRIAMVAAGFSGGESEQLRRAMGFKRPGAAMQKMDERLRKGLEEKGIKGENAETVVRYITSFALYGFPESHAASFALLAYASAYYKAHYPTQFYTALLNNQPMGFYHPSTLVRDGMRRGLLFLPVDVNVSEWLCTIEEDGQVRLGISYVRGFAKDKGNRISAERQRRPFRSLEELRERAGLGRSELTALSRVGALESLGMERREALWQAEKVSRQSGPLLSSLEDGGELCPLAEMDISERMLADYSGTGLTTGPHPMELARDTLSTRGVVPAERLGEIKDGSKVSVAGSVIVRQRPMTAKGFLFLSLEDETGISNIIIRPKKFEQYRQVILENSFLLVSGGLQNSRGVISVLAEKAENLDLSDPGISSYDFH